MKRNVLNRVLAAALSLSTALSLCGCGDKGVEDTPTDTAESTSIAAEVTEEVTSAPAFFDENYDPFADDYDPYGGGGAATDANPVAVTEQSENVDVTEAVTTKANVTEAAATKTSEATTSATAVKTETPSATNECTSDAELIMSVPNGWNDGTNDFSQVDVTIKNNGKSTIDGWTVTIKADAKAQVEQSWNCEISLSGGTLTITPAEHNSTIEPNGEGTFGLILKNPGKLDADKASLTCKTGTYTAASSGTQNSQSTQNTSSKSTAAKDVPEPTTDDWLSVKGNKIVDQNGKEVWLTGINWFGYNTGTNTFDGLWSCDLNSSLAAIADRGFNLLRVPISAELINDWAAGNYPTANFNQATNSYLVGMNSLEIFDYVVGQCRANGLKIMLDLHSARTDSMGHMTNMWYDGNVSEQDYLDALAWMAERYKNDDTIIAFDLKNEPHGKANESPRAKWDNSTDSDNWKYIAEKAAMAVLNKNPNVLIMVEGIEIYPKDIKSNGSFASTDPNDYYTTWWGGNLRGVKDNPIDLGKYQNKLVYSPHDYGPAVYQQSWFSGDYTYQSLYDDVWYDNWFYIQKSGTAPLLIGEWGGYMTQPNLKWMTYLRQFIKENKINHTFWCFNSNSGDTGGLVKDDFTTWDEEKYEFVKEVLWQEDGKFVGLDHVIPLGSNGKTLS